MSHIDAVLCDVRGAKVFAAINFTSGYRQLPLHADNQHLHAFMSADGLMEITRTIQGGRKSAASFQVYVESRYGEIRENPLCCLDDFALFDRTDDTLQHILPRSFELSLKHNLTISLPKSTFIAKETQWCGWKIDATGVIIDWLTYQGIHDAYKTSVAGEICQYVHYIARMRSDFQFF